MKMPAASASVGIRSGSRRGKEHSARQKVVFSRKDQYPTLLQCVDITF